VPALPPAAPAAPAEEIAAILAPHPIFARFDRASLLAVATQCGFATYPAETTLMREGESGDFACVILEGEADVFVELPAGPIHMARLGRNRIIGELSVFTDLPRTATVIARTYLVVVRIDRDSMMRLCAEYPSIGAAVIGELGGRLAGMNRALASLTYAAEAFGRDEYDAAMIDELSSQQGATASFAQAFAGMAAELQAKQDRRREMQAAAVIQQSILPPPLPSTARVDLHAEMHPAREIGGDFYDYFMLDGDRFAVTVADVSGKGIPAALFMAVSQTVLRGVASEGDDMAAGMAAANRVLSAQNAAAMFVTVFHGVVDLSSGALRYCNAGHNPPYLLRAGGGHEMLHATGVPFGIDPGGFYRIGETVLLPGDGLFLYSDGITEADNPQRELYGSERLERALERLRGRGAAEIVSEILADTNRFASGAEQADDITCLALRYQP
jgi:serine phosphatase RsbU (regulator of sigma subunit)